AGGLGVVDVLDRGHVEPRPAHLGGPTYGLLDGVDPRDAANEELASAARAPQEEEDEGEEHEGEGGHVHATQVEPLGHGDGGTEEQRRRRTAGSERREAVEESLAGRNP